MKTKPLFFCMAILSSALLALLASAQSYKMTFALSPDETNNAVAGYVGVWRFTNAASSNDWRTFILVPAGITNMPISSLVPSPAYLAVRTQGTNSLLSSPTNTVLYDTNALALVYTNVPTPPRPAGVPSLSN
jgi:hypothetical protein